MGRERKIAQACTDFSQLNSLNSACLFVLSITYMHALHVQYYLPKIFKHQ